MALITLNYRERPVENVMVYLEAGEDTIPLYESKRLVEDYISNGVPVTLFSVEGHQSIVPRGIYILAQTGHKLEAIRLLRATGYQISTLGRKMGA